MASQGVFSFEAAELVVPSEVTLDTSFVVHALVRGEKHHEGARAFLERLAEEGTALAFNEMGAAGLSSYDAIHAATAEYVGSRTLVTTDIAFASVPPRRLALYTSANRVGRCRAIRSA